MKGSTYFYTHRHTQLASLVLSWQSGQGEGKSACLFKTVRLQGADGICFQSLFFVWLHKRGSLSLLNLPPPISLYWGGAGCRENAAGGRSKAEEDGKEPYWGGGNGGAVGFQKVNLGLP